jgi:hypothetical protein
MPHDLSGLDISQAQALAVSQKMEEALAEATHPYPWESLEQDLERRSLSTISVVAYGSLLNAASAAQTFRDSSPASPRRPVIAFGVRRIFNYEMPPGGGRYGPPTSPRANAALNIRTTADINDAVNGILVETTLEDIPALRAREVGYDLVPVACLGWNQTKEPPSLAYILSSPNEPRAGRKRTNDTLKPHREYYRVCRRGAAEVGKEFLNFWLSTTYLADGVTPVGQWEASEFPEMRTHGTSRRRS